MRAITDAASAANDKDRHADYVWLWMADTLGLGLCTPARCARRTMSASAHTIVDFASQSSRVANQEKPARIYRQKMRWLNNEEQN